MSSSLNPNAAPFIPMRNLQDMALVPGIIVCISDFLSAKDCISMQLVCKRHSNIIPKKIVRSLKYCHVRVGTGFTVNDRKNLFDNDVYILSKNLNWIYVKCRWKDQGWGSLKSFLLLQLKRDSKVIAECNLFGLANHGFRSQEVTVSRGSITGRKFCAMSRPGDKLAFVAYKKGMGGNHSVNIKHFHAVFSFARND